MQEYMFTETSKFSRVQQQATVDCVFHQLHHQAQHRFHLTHNSMANKQQTDCATLCQFPMLNNDVT